MKISKNNLSIILFYIYFFFLSFLNFTPFYLISALLMIFITILNAFLQKKFVLTSYFYFQIIFIFYNIFYVVFGITINNVSTLQIIKTLLLNFMINISIINIINNQEKLEKVIYCIIPIAFFACSFIIVYSGGTGVNGRLGHGVERLFSSTRYMSMEFSMWAVYAIVLCQNIILSKKDNKYYFLILFFMIVIVLGGSRRCLFLVIVLYILNYFLHNRDAGFKKKLEKIFKIIIITIIVFISIFNVPFLYNKVGYRIDNYFNNSDSSGNTRDIMRATAIEYIKEHPIRGYGLNTYRDISEFKTWSECNYLEIAFGGGIPLLLIYYGYILYLVVYFYKTRKKDDIHRNFFIIVFCQVLFDYMSMSYIERFDTFFIAAASLLMYFDKNKKVG